MVDVLGELSLAEEAIAAEPEDGTTVPNEVGNMEVTSMVKDMDVAAEKENKSKVA